MLRKTFLLGGAAVVLLGLLLGRSHLLTTVGLVKQQVRDSVPIDFEIKRARQMIKDLRPEIEKNLRLIAQEEVEVAALENDLNRSETRLTKDRDDILRLKSDLDSGAAVFVYSGRRYSTKEVKTDLAARFAQFKTQEATTSSLKQILVARQTSLQAAREKLDGMLDAKRQLEVDVENLEARMAMVEVARTTSNFNFDDSQLARTKELIQGISTRIDVAEKLVNADVHYFDRIPLDEPSQGEQDIRDEITDYFGEGRISIERLVDGRDR